MIWIFRYLYYSIIAHFKSDAFQFQFGRNSSISEVLLLFNNFNAAGVTSSDNGQFKRQNCDIYGQYDIFVQLLPWMLHYSEQLSQKSGFCEIYQFQIFSASSNLLGLPVKSHLKNNTQTFSINLRWKFFAFHWISLFQKCFSSHQSTLLVSACACAVLPPCLTVLPNKSWIAVLLCRFFWSKLLVVCTKAKKTEENN